MLIVDIENLIDGGKSIYDRMTATQYGIDRSWEHCHRAFWHIKNKYDAPAAEMTAEEMDFLCLSLGWYLASWGMLRNSFLNEYSHEIHGDAIRLLYDPRWAPLWNIDYRNLDEGSAALILNLAKELEEIYKGIHSFDREDYELTDTLKTKILLGTVACVPAYDRFFVAALRHTLGKTRFCQESLLELAAVYRENKESFASMQVHCGGSYPAAKLLDMCFFDYGQRLSAVETVAKAVIKTRIDNLNPRCTMGRQITNFICLYTLHGDRVKAIPCLLNVYGGNSAVYDRIRRELVACQAD